MTTAFIILGVSILGAIAVGQAVQIARLSKKLFSEYVVKGNNQVNN